MRNKLALLVALLFIAVSARLTLTTTLADSTQPEETKTAPATTDATPAKKETAAIDLGNLDRTCKPCDDFYKFANGGWIAKNPIPAAYPSWGTFNLLAQNNRETLKTILDTAKDAKAAPGSVEQKVGDFYCSCMDAEKIEAAGLKPLQPELDRIAALKNPKEVQAAIAHLHTIGVNVLFGFGSNQDAKDATKVLADARQGGLGLPETEYYTKDDEDSKKLRDQYLTHVAKMFELAGEDAAKSKANAQTVLEMETGLAKNSLNSIQLRDPEASYHKMKLAEAEKLTPDFSWNAYFAQIGLKKVEDINLEQPEFFKEVNRQMTATSLESWKVYLRWHLLNQTANALPAKFVEENFNFNGKILTGAREIQPRWRRCVNATDGNLGEALGQLYVKKAFPPESKARMLEIVKNIRTALRDDLKTLSWMGDATRKQALHKLDSIAVKIGYPDKWKDYSSVAISRDQYLANIFRASAFEYRLDLEKIGKPVDRSVWGMTPPTVNAYYNPQLNEIVFPAGILQFPFFNASADDAVNYGAIGVVIGHEITHGFDDEGRQFDADGNLKNWWTETDLKNFEERAKCIEHQFDSYTVLDNLHHKGKLVSGESIADLGGLTIAWAAYQESLKGKPAPKDIDGFSHEQRFFLGYAQVWAGSQRPEATKLQLATDPHPLPEFRVNGPLSNMEVFRKAFGCAGTVPMVRSEKDTCKIW
ncbi:MAG: M13 family metallopeptidase [Blastocatellia bacterium]|nr:M13 family metallopeptidase [Blastocatellia bacterium]